MLRLFVTLFLCLSAIHPVWAEEDKRDAYWKLLSERRHGWSKSAPTRVLWDVYTDYAERATKLKDHKRALILAEAALEHTRAWRPNDERTVRTLNLIKVNCEETGLIVEGDDKILSVVAREAPPAIPDFMRRKALTLDPEVSIESFIRESDLLAVEGKSNLALTNYLKILAALESATAKDGGIIVKVVDRITRMYYKERRFREAEDLVRKEIKGRETMASTLHEKDPERLELAFLFSDLGLAYTGQDRFFEAEALYKECLHIMRPFMKDDHPDVIVTLSSLALVHKYMGDIKSAKKEYIQLISSMKNNPAISGESAAVIMNNYAKMLRESGEIRQAERIEAEAKRRGGHSIVQKH